MELNKIRERTREALEVAASRGHFPGPAGRGAVKVGKKTELDEVGRRVVWLRAEGWSLRRIAAEVGIEHPVQVSRILKKAARLGVGEEVA